MVCDGFLGLAASTSVGLGVPNIAIATVPGHTGVQSKEELRGNILGVTMDEIVDNLTREPETATQETEPGAYDIVVKGGFEEVNRYFYEHALSDGLPVVPPTRERVEQFLRFTDRSPDEVLGILLPDSRAATRSRVRHFASRPTRGITGARPVAPPMSRWASAPETPGRRPTMRAPSVWFR